MSAARHRGWLGGRAALAMPPIVTLALLLGSGVGLAAEGAAGITEPVALPAFDPAAPGCHLPAGLKKALGFSQDNRRKFIEGVGYGLSRAAADRGLGYESQVAENDAAAQERHIAAFVDSGVGAVVVAPVDPASLAPTMRKVIWSGAYLGTVVPPPATTILNAPQYLTGKVLGDAAAAYIREQWEGKANVVLLTQDSLQFLAPRFVAIRDALKDLPAVNVIADISPNPVNEEGGYATMKLILEAHPNIDVVLGSDTVVLGALRALREAGKARPDQFLGGIDGEPGAVSEIATGESPYKTSIALSSPVFGYALGALAADWLEGKRVPQAMDILPIALTRSNLAAYAADQADPARVYADPARRAAYLRMYGSICYDERDRYLDFPWSSEAH